jgi:hypothetical protein
MDCDTTLTTGERLRIVVRPGNPSAVDIYDGSRLVGGAVTLVDARIRGLAAHPDGALVLIGGRVGKVTRDPTASWTYKEVTDPADLTLAGVADDPTWSATSPTPSQ